ncbi:MAG: uroporphyrinogen decarboxylase [Chloroflexi bacterium]|nr:uroporphyrinogen decarboxylase [Chloroflexota bacterium]
MGMTSRERVTKAINHQEPDRIPVDLNPLYDFYVQLKNYLGLENEEKIGHNLAMEVIPHPEVLKNLGVDLTAVKLGSVKGAVKEERSDGLVKDDWGILYKLVNQPGGGRYYEVVHSPLKDATLKDLDHYSWPVADLPGRGEGAEAAAKHLFEDTDLAIMGRFGGAITEIALYMLGMENWMTRLATDPEFIHALLTRIADIQIALDRIGLEATAKYLTIYKASGEDLGMQMGPMYSPKMFRQMFLPYFKRRFQAAREYLDEVNPGVKIMLHSCGSIRRFLPDLIEAGVDIIDPVQPHAAEMNTAELKRDFGSQLTFHGAVDIQQVLPFGTAEEIDQEVKERITTLGKGGGYILAPAHNVQADVPPKNIVRMCEAVGKFGSYPLS